MKKRPIQNTINNYGNSSQSATPASYPDGISVDVDDYMHSIIFQNYNDHPVTVSFTVTYVDFFDKRTVKLTLQKVLEGKPADRPYFEDFWGDTSKDIISVNPGYSSATR
jgi:hypothetical protein